ncbi:MAG: preprotein translocase subunit YajC, partial [Acidimicrobiales bacterium]
MSISAFVLAKTSAKASTSGSSAATLIFILVLGVLAYVFFIRPRSAQARRQRDTLQEVSVGDEILTGAGIFGRVLDVEADRITIETAPGTRITVLRSTIARRLTEPPEEETNWDTDGEASANGTAEDRHEAIEAGSDDHADDHPDDHAHDHPDDHAQGEDPHDESN